MSFSTKAKQFNKEWFKTLKIDSNYNAQYTISYVYSCNAKSNTLVQDQRSTTIQFIISSTKPLCILARQTKWFTATKSLMKSNGMKKCIAHFLFLDGWKWMSPWEVFTWLDKLFDALTCGSLCWIHSPTVRRHRREDITRSLSRTNLCRPPDWWDISHSMVNHTLQHTSCLLAVCFWRVLGRRLILRLGH